MNECEGLWEGIYVEEGCSGTATGNLCHKCFHNVAALLQFGYAVVQRPNNNTNK